MKTIKDADKLLFFIFGKNSGSNQTCSYIYQIKKIHGSAFLFPYNFVHSNLRKSVPEEIPGWVS